MKYFKSSLAGVMVAVVSIYLTGCEKLNCDKIYTGLRAPTISLDFRDKQNRDLLNPATPGHYDTAKIRQLNTSLVRYIVTGVGGPNKDRINVVLNWTAGETTSYLKFSTTQQDTIHTNYIGKPSTCSTVFELTEFSYNGKPYTDSIVNRYFIIQK